MKKFLCLLFCILGCLFACFWTVTYVVLGYQEHTHRFTELLMVANVAIFVLALILEFCVIKISVDQWFPDGDSDIMSIKDKVLLTIVVLITLICAGIFVLTIVNNNINAIRVSESDNMRLRALMLVIANAFMAFSYYQHFQVVKFIE